MYKTLIPLTNRCIDRLLIAGITSKYSTVACTDVSDIDKRMKILKPSRFEFEPNYTAQELT